MNLSVLKVFVDDIMVRLRAHTALANAHHEPYTDTEVNALIAVHAAVSNAHHEPYTDTEVNALIAVHAAIASAHHTDHQLASAEDADFKTVNIAAGQGYKQGTNTILRQLTTNVFLSNGAGGSSVTGSLNTALGNNAGGNLTSGKRNAFVGAAAGYNNDWGNYNTALGAYAGFGLTSGEYNTLVGYQAGYHISSRDKSVCIGYKSAYNVNINEILYIANGSGNANVLIHGEFDNKYLFHKGAASAPADAKLHNSDINFWLDEVNDRLQIKVKKSDGTVLTGFVQLA